MKATTGSSARAMIARAAARPTAASATAEDEYAKALALDPEPDAAIDYFVRRYGLSSEAVRALAR